MRAKCQQRPAHHKPLGERLKRAPNPRHNAAQFGLRLRKLRLYIPRLRTLPLRPRRARIRRCGYWRSGGRRSGGRRSLRRRRWRRICRHSSGRRRLRRRICRRRNGGRGLRRRIWRRSGYGRGLRPRRYWRIRRRRRDLRPRIRNGRLNAPSSAAIPAKPIRGRILAPAPPANEHAAHFVLRRLRLRLLSRRAYIRRRSR